MLVFCHGIDMPAISIGVTEIEERLEAVRRRLNQVLALRAGCVAASALFILLTLTVISGLHHRLSNHGLFGVAVVTALIALASAAYASVRRKWYDLSTTARIIDERAELADRLTTLITMRQERRPGRLMPVLIAQLIALMPRWQPPQVAPTQLPRVALVCAASAVLLAVSVWLEPPPPEPPPAPPAAAQPPAAPAVQAPQQPDHVTAPRGAEHGATRDHQASDDEGQTAEGEESQLDSAKQPPGEGADAAANSTHDSSGSAPHDRSERGSAAPQPMKVAKAPDEAGRDQGRSDAEHAPKESGKQLPNSEAQQQPRQPGDMNHSRPQEEAQRNEDGSGKQDGELGGHSASSSRGSGASNIFDSQNATAPMADDTAPHSFKITITSFLNAAESRQRPRSRSGKRGAPGSGGSSNDSDTALNEHQQNDDALRKAEIPLEYEDIVRRVYSARTDQ